jgi:hypothetical protein
MTITHAGASTNRREVGRPYAGIPERARGLPLVFLYRNPIDTAVSMFYQITRRDLPKGSGRWYRMYLPLLLRGALPPQERGGSVCLNRFLAFSKWFSALVTPPSLGALAC